GGRGRAPDVRRRGPRGDVPRCGALVHDEGRGARQAPAGPRATEGGLAIAPDKLIVQLRVAIVGHGAIGHVIERALEGNVSELVRIDRTRAPLRAQEPPVDVAIVCVKAQGTSWAADVTKRLLSPNGMAITLQNGLGNFERLADAVGDRAAVGVIYVGARLDEDGALHA